MNKMLLSCLLYFISTATLSEPDFFTLQSNNFRSLLPITGSCEIDEVTEQIFDISGSRICSQNLIGNIGEFEIHATPNKTIDIKILQRTPVDNDGITFTPKGKLISDVQTVNILPSYLHQINSGASGIVEIKLAGQLYITKSLVAGASYNLIMLDGIEFSERD
jgi:hypothetical protein